MRCFEGLDCEQNASCKECQGVGCTRVVNLDPESNGYLAFTCLPTETRDYLLEMDGCRNNGFQIHCVCYTHDYCNLSNSFNLLLPFLLLLLFLLFR